MKGLSLYWKVVFTALTVGAFGYFYPKVSPCEIVLILICLFILVALWGGDYVDLDN